MNESVEPEGSEKRQNISTNGRSAAEDARYSEAVMPHTDPARYNADGAGNAGRSGGRISQLDRNKDLSDVFRRVTVPEPARLPSSNKAGTERQRTGPVNDISAARDVFWETTGSHPNSDPGFTTMFRSLAEKESSVDVGKNRVNENDRPAQSSAGEQIVKWDRAARADERQPPVVEGPGEFTRLFERLDQQKGENIVQNQPIVYQSPAKLGVQDHRGGFTQLLRTLSSENHAELPAQVPAPLLHSPAEGPGEFTRIISHSALREAMDREERRDAPTASEPAAPVESRPEFPAAFVAAGATPPEIQIPPMMASIPASRPIEQVVAPPVAFPLSSTPTPPQPQAPGWLQQHFPLLLIANLFLMLLILLLVVYVLLRAH
jgi:hypothetical protein